MEKKQLVWRIGSNTIIISVTVASGSNDVLAELTNNTGTLFLWIVYNISCPKI